MDEIRIRKRRGYTLLMICFMVIFAAGCAMPLLIDFHCDDSTRPARCKSLRMIGPWVAPIVATIAIYWTYHLVRRTPFLTLSRGGLWLRDLPTGHLPWAGITGVRWRWPRNKVFLVLELDQPPRLSLRNSWLVTIFRWFVWIVTTCDFGREISIRVMGLDCGADELMSRIQEGRTAAARSSENGPFSSKLSTTS